MAGGFVFGVVPVRLESSASVTTVGIGFHPEILVSSESRGNERGPKAGAEIASLRAVPRKTRREFAYY
jgi:hypothetical protein